MRRYIGLLHRTNFQSCLRLKQELTQSEFDAKYPISSLAPWPSSRLHPALEIFDFRSGSTTAHLCAVNK